MKILSGATLTGSLNVSLSEGNLIKFLCGFLLITPPTGAGGFYKNLEIFVTCFYGKATPTGSLIFLCFWEFGKNFDEGFF